MRTGPGGAGRWGPPWWVGWVGSPGARRPHLPKQRHRLSAKREKEEEPRCPGQEGTRVPVTGPPPASPTTRLSEGPEASSSLPLHPNTGVGVGCLCPHLCEACVPSFGSLLVPGAPS